MIPIIYSEIILQLTWFEVKFYAVHFLPSKGLSSKVFCLKRLGLVCQLGVKQRTRYERVFGDKSETIFSCSPQKHVVGTH